MGGVQIFPHVLPPLQHLRSACLADFRSVPPQGQGLSSRRRSTRTPPRLGSLCGIGHGEKAVDHIPSAHNVVGCVGCVAFPDHIRPYLGCAFTSDHRWKYAVGMFSFALYNSPEEGDVDAFDLSTAIAASVISTACSLADSYKARRAILKDFVRRSSRYIFRRRRLLRGGGESTMWLRIRGSAEADWRKAESRWRASRAKGRGKNLARLDKGP